jgi:hypothetical protein
MRTLFAFVLVSVATMQAASVITYLTPGVGTDAVPISGVRVSGDEFQEVYSSSLFGSSPLDLLSVAFSSSARSGGTDATTLYGSATITLSTTTRTPGAPGNWSLSNEGADKQVVFSGYFTTSVKHNSTFDIGFNFSAPFRFDPTAGNLLLDFVWNTTPTTNGTLDLSASYGSALVGSNSFTTQYGNFGAANTGVATQFAVNPEPGTWLLSGSALLGCALLMRRAREASRS